MIRLYANIVAGHIVLMSLIGLMFLFKSWLGSSLSFGLSFAISLIEILVALLQAIYNAVCFIFWLALKNTTMKNTSLKLEIET